MKQTLWQPYSSARDFRFFGSNFVKFVVFVPDIETELTECTSCWYFLKFQVVVENQV